jgi:hypothetical protein
VGIAVGSSLVCLLLMEAALSLAAPSGWLRFDFANARGRKTGLYVYDRDLGWRNRPGFDAEHEWVHRTTREKINREGWRDRSYPLLKDADAFRIAVLGCSFTYGLGVDMEEAYPHRLEEILNALGKQRFDVMNFGVNGYGTAQMLLNYEKFVRRYRPDLVILQLFDFNIHRTLYTRMFLTEKPSFALQDRRLVLLNHPVPEDRYRPLQRWLLDRSLVYGLLLDRWLRTSVLAKRETKEALETNREARALVVRMLGRLREWTRADGAELLVLTDHVWMGLAARAGVEAFDIDAQVDVRRWSDRGDIYNPPPVGHWSRLGHDYVAHAVFEYLSGRSKRDAP